MRRLAMKLSHVSELNDQPSSRSASLQPAMGVGRLFRRIDIRHAKRDVASLDQLPETIELFPLVRIGAHPGWREADIALRDTLKATDGGKGPALANGGDDECVEHRAVREPIDALREMFAKPRRDIIAPANDDVRAKRGDQLLVFFGGVGDDRQSLEFGELDDIAAIGSRGTGHGDDPARRKL